MGEEAGMIRPETSEDVLAFARSLQDGSLPGSVVCLTSRSWEKEPAISLTDLREEAAGLLPVGGVYFLPTGPLSREFSEAMPPKMDVYGGAARVWWPPVDGDADPGDHPLIHDRYDIYGTHAIERIGRELRSGPPTERRSVEVQEITLLRRRLSEMELRAVRAEESARELEIRLSDERSRRLEADRRARDFKLYSAAASSGPGPLPHEPASPDEELIREILEAWLDACSSAEDRLQFPLGPYWLQAGFVGDSLELSPQHRERLPWVCAMVACDRAADLAGLSLHPLRTGAGGSDPQRRRANDGALAWRVALKTNTPGAPRVHYWQLDNGGIEFSTVGHHDEFEIAE